MSKYKRWPDLEAEIQRVYRLPQSKWLEEVTSLQPETLVFLARRTDRGFQELFGRLLLEIARRAVVVSKRWARGLKEAEFVVSQVESEILQLFLDETKFSQSEFLEYSFATAVERRTLNAVEKYKNSTMGKCDELHSESDGNDDEEFDEIERPGKSSADDVPDQLAALLQMEDETFNSESFKKACAVVKNRRHLEAVILHHVEGWPVTSKDPTKLTLERHFKVPAHKIHDWIKKALKAMKDALGEQE